ncbi:MAG: ribokinase [Thermoleophilia bacterium]|nr:ribokinase [Thermoleophilia bacterium]
MDGHVVCVGAATLDTVLAVPDHPPRDGRVVASELTVAGGGPAATAAVALARLGVTASLVAAVGDDEAGAAIRAGLEEEGVGTSELVTVRGARSAQSCVLVDRSSRGRAIAAFPGTLPPLELTPGARELCRRAAWVHADHVGFAAVRPLVGGARVSVDGGNPIAELELDGLSLYAPTEAALRALFPALDLEQALRAAATAGAELVVATRGGEGSVAATRSGELVAAPPLAVDAVSTLGAGDVFHGALLAQLVRGARLREALTAANAAAALSCRALDGRSAIPTADELGAALAGVR